MRTAFFSSLEELAAADDRIHLLTGDLGFGVIERFAKRFPDRFINVGVAEQNMTGVATGLALSGKVVFTYSIGNFPTLRCLEQIRNGACYHRANVKIVSVGGGLAYGSLGMSHHATEDLAIMRALPNLTVIAPADPVETAAATRAITQMNGPVYLRLGRAGEPVVHKQPPDFQIGRALRVRDGTDLTLISTGGMLASTLEVADAFAERGLSCRVLSLHTIKPIDEAAIVAAVQETRLVATIEEHSRSGGLGGAVAEVVASVAGRSAPLVRVGLADAFVPFAGSRDYLVDQLGISPARIVATLTDALKRTGGSA